MPNGVSTKLKRMAVEAADRFRDDDYRVHAIGAIAVREDGAIVKSANGSNWDTSRQPSIHAEAKVLRKAGFGAKLIVVVRVRNDGSLGLAKPCTHCQTLIRNRGVKRCYYSTDNNSFECLQLD